jgi:hypothetical protein
MPGRMPGATKLAPETGASCPQLTLVCTPRVGMYTIVPVDAHTCVHNVAQHLAPRKQEGPLASSIQSGLGLRPSGRTAITYLPSSVLTWGLGQNLPLEFFHRPKGGARQVTKSTLFTTLTNQVSKTSAICAKPGMVVHGCNQESEARGS